MAAVLSETLSAPDLSMASMSSDGAQPAADRERHEALLGGRGDDVAHDLPAVARGGDVEEDELVRALGVVGLGAFDRVAGVAQLLEPDALDHAPGGHVQAGDDAAASSISPPSGRCPARS